MDDTVKVGKVVFKLSVSTAEFSEAMRRFSVAVKIAGQFIHRGNWWKRSDGPPDFIADANDPEWWQDGDEPPEWGCAA